MVAAMCDPCGSRPIAPTPVISVRSPTALSESSPDRLSTDPSSPFHDAALLERGVGIRFNGAEKTNVEEYCVSEGWVRVSAGKAKDRMGRPITLKLKGRVEPYFRDSP